MATNMGCAVRTIDKDVLNDTLLLSLLHSQLLPNYTARWLAIVKQKWSASVVGKRNGKLNSDLTGASYVIRPPKHNILLQIFNVYWQNGRRTL